jgi:hypothetical protein
MKPDIQIRSFDFAVRILRMCAELDKTIDVSRTLLNQVLRSGTSIGANEIVAILTVIVKRLRDNSYFTSHYSLFKTLP